MLFNRFLKKEKEKNIVYDTSNRYYIEHDLLPELILGENGVSILYGLLKEKGEFFVDLFNRLNSEDINYHCPYKISDYKIRGIKLNDDKYCVEISLPRPEREPLCKNIYIIHGQHYEDRRYFTIERGHSEKEQFLCEWTSDKKHKLYTACTDNILQEILRIIS